MFLGSLKIVHDILEKQWEEVVPDSKTMRNPFDKCLIRTNFRFFDGASFNVKINTFVALVAFLSAMIMTKKSFLF